MWVDVKTVGDFVGPIRQKTPRFAVFGELAVVGDLAPDGNSLIGGPPLPIVGSKYDEDRRRLSREVDEVVPTLNKLGRLTGVEYEIGVELVEIVDGSTVSGQVANRLRDQVRQSIRAAGKAGLPVIEYNFYAHRIIEGYYDDINPAHPLLTLHLIG